MSKIKLGIIGAGKIAIEHLKVISSFKNLQVSAITSRTIDKAKKLSENFGIPKTYEVIDDMISNEKVDGLMVLVSADQIFNVTSSLIPLKIPLFIEKPPGLSINESKQLSNLSVKYNTRNMVGFNRRYYTHFHKGLKIIEDAGGLLGLSITGHERFWKITRENTQENIRENWFYANSTHTIDLLRFFGGKIAHQQSFKNSISLINGDQFVASLKFNSGALGTYTSHWLSPGGWSVVLYGNGRTVVFNPLESGYWQDKEFKKYSLEPDSIDLKHKLGFYGQLKAFIELIKNGNLGWPGMDLKESYKTMLLTKKIIGI